MSETHFFSKLNLAQFIMTEQFLCKVLEVIINKALALNETNNNVSVLSKLDQKSMVVSIEEVGFPLCFTISHAVTNKVNILVTTLYERNDCHIKTSIKTLLALKKEQQLTTLIKQEKLDIQGDIKVAQQFAQLAENLNIDWESELAKHIGDIPTHKLGQFSQRMKERLSFAAEQIQADASEWLVHEKKLAATGNQISQFAENVEEVNSIANQLEQRILRLSKKINASTLVKG